VCHTGASQALAEFIDNSLQATNEEPSRKIDIILATERSSSKGESCKYIVVLDNGCGMDLKELQEFATYSLDQVTKGKELKSGKSMISKFGVGAKNAGFYLGEKLCVITKKKQSTKVLELVLDKKGMDEKYREGRADEVFRATVPVRLAGAKSGILEDCSLPDSVTREIRTMETGSCFTAIIIKLKPRHQLQICQELQITKQELANIYHFYLNPNDLPDTLIPELSARNPTL
jgi:structural maintenance of chromosomes flexible hinge domain-containing protein 1